MDKPSVYIETSIVSYLTARPSNNLLASVWQTATVDWWNRRREYFRIVTSEIVVTEASKGGTEAVARRLEALVGIPVLNITDSARELSRTLLQAGGLPEKAIADSMHVAVSAVNAIDYLLTWNVRHLGNAEMRPVIRRICLAKGYASPEIGTPQELMGVTNMADEIITELWQIKDEMAREAGYDLDAYIASIHARIKELGVKTVDRIDEAAPDAGTPNVPNRGKD